MKETIANIERLIDDLTKYSMQCEDIFTKCVVGESIKMLPDIISPIQEELKSEAKETLNRQANETK